MTSSSLLERVIEVVDGSTIEEIAEVAEVLSVIIISSMPDQEEAMRLYGEAIARSLSIARRDVPGQDYVQ